MNNNELKKNSIYFVIDNRYGFRKIRLLDYNNKYHPDLWCCELLATGFVVFLKPDEIVSKYDNI